MVLDGKCHKLFQRAFFPSQIEFYELVFVLPGAKLRSDGMELRLWFKKLREGWGLQSFQKFIYFSLQQNIKDLAAFVN